MNKRNRNITKPTLTELQQMISPNKFKTENKNYYLSGLEKNNKYI